MAGIYIHIPFCKQACSYCNFHFSTNLNNKEALLGALRLELEQRKAYLNGAEIHSIYFGGGTPSLLSADEISTLIRQISKLHPIADDVEITLETNPDDLSGEKIAAIKDTAVNRLSIGIQSFYDDELHYMHRAHTASEGLASLERALSAGFRSLTMDLIYGTPLLTKERWAESLHQVASLGIPHLSAYQLTIEPRTALAHAIRSGQSESPNDENTVLQFEMLMDWAEDSGYEHYEISNLSRPWHRAVHNSNYWKGIPYLGIGPSAHSFDGSSREWNVANNTLYVKAITSGSAREGIEQVSAQAGYNEYIMTGLRTTDGVTMEKIRTFPVEYGEYFQNAVIPFIHNGQIISEEDSWKLSRSGKFFADRIAAELFVVKETQ